MTKIATVSEFEQFCLPVAGGEPLAVVCFHSQFSVYSRRALVALSVVELDFPFVAFGSVDVDLNAFGEVVNKLELSGLPCVIAFARGHAGALSGRSTWLGERSAAKYAELVLAFVGRCAQ